MWDDLCRDYPALVQHPTPGRCHLNAATQSIHAAFPLNGAAKMSKMSTFFLEGRKTPISTYVFWTLIGRVESSTTLVNRKKSSCNIASDWIGSLMKVSYCLDRFLDYVNKMTILSTTTTTSMCKNTLILFSLCGVSEYEQPVHQPTCPQRRDYQIVVSQCFFWLQPGYCLLGGIILFCWEGNTLIYVQHEFKELKTES